MKPIVRGKCRIGTKKWSEQWDSNPRPSRWQRDALPLSYARTFYYDEVICHLFIKNQVRKSKKFLFFINWGSQIEKTGSTWYI